jgi:hypothetical protein
MNLRLETPLRGRAENPAEAAGSAAMVPTGRRIAVDAGCLPEAGDVVVKPEIRESHLVYVLGVEGGIDQISCATRSDATARALAFARRAGVNAWYGDRPEFGLVLLGRFLDGAPLEQPHEHSGASRSTGPNSAR